MSAQFSARSVCNHHIFFTFSFIAHKRIVSAAKLINNKIIRWNHCTVDENKEDKEAVAMFAEDYTYAKLHNEGVNNTSNDRYEIECIPRIFEKIL